MTRIFLIVISILCLQICNAQRVLDSLSQQVRQADSIWVLNFSRMPEREKVSKSIQQGILDSIENNLITKLDRQNLIQFSSIIKKRYDFKGRYSSLSGFTSGQGILLWKNGYFSYFETCLPCHRIKIYFNSASQLIALSPPKTYDIKNFFLENGIIKRVNRTIYL